jgi:hypothetical protein
MTGFAQNNTYIRAEGPVSWMDLCNAMPLHLYFFLGMPLITMVVYIECIMSPFFYQMLLPASWVVEHASSIDIPKCTVSFGYGVT